MPRPEPQAFYPVREHWGIANLGRPTLAPMVRRVGALVAALTALALGTVPTARAAGTVGTELPPDFPEIIDHSLGVPVLGFGSNEGPVERVPVVFLHGNNDTSHPTTCNGGYGKIQGMAQFFADHGYSLKELWGLSYQGDQCDLVTNQNLRSGEAHSTAANVPDVRAFVNAVMAYTGAQQVDIVGHSLGVTLTREWMRQDSAHGKVRRLVAVDGPSHGIINCSPNPLNFWQHVGGFTPDSAICQEYGSDHTPLLSALNAGDETPGPTEYLAVVNVDASFVYMDRVDGIVPPVPAEDRDGNPHDFSKSAWLEGAQRTVEVTGAGAHDPVLQAAHTGIINDPDVWQAAFDFLSPQARPDATTSAAPPPAPGRPAPAAPAPPSRGRSGLPATGGAPFIVPGLCALGLFLFGRRSWGSKSRESFAITPTTRAEI